MSVRPFLRHAARRSTGEVKLHVATLAEDNIIAWGWWIDDKLWEAQAFLSANELSAERMFAMMFTLCLNRFKNSSQIELVLSNKAIKFWQQNNYIAKNLVLNCKAVPKLESFRKGQELEIEDCLRKAKKRVLDIKEVLQKMPELNTTEYGKFLNQDGLKITLSPFNTDDKVWLKPADLQWVFENKARIIYTDGSIVHSSGGWAWFENNKNYASGKCIKDPNYAELEAVLHALRTVKGPLLIVTDCSRVLEHKNNIANSLESELAKAAHDKARFVWTRGHGGNPGNAIADFLAKKAAMS